MTSCNIDRVVAPRCHVTGSSFQGTLLFRMLNNNHFDIYNCFSFLCIHYTRFCIDELNMGNRMEFETPCKYSHPTLNHLTKCMLALRLGAQRFVKMAEQPIDQLLFNQSVHRTVHHSISHLDHGFMMDLSQNSKLCF